MEDKAPGFSETVFLWASLIFAWLSGETGRVMVAAGLGGALRWMVSETRKLRDGAISIAGGVIVGTYTWPALLHAPTWLPFGSQQPFAETPDNAVMAALLAGVLGMSAIKIFIAVVEAYGVHTVRRLKSQGEVQPHTDRSDPDAQP